MLHHRFEGSSQEVSKCQDEDTNQEPATGHILASLRLKYNLGPKSKFHFIFGEIVWRKFSSNDSIFLKVPK